MTSFHVHSQPRHLRYIFFIDVATPYLDLLKLIKANLKFWGGRYNPIVPVADGVIPDCYLHVIENYDPDFIFHSSTVDAENIKKLRYFHPSAYVNLDPQFMAQNIEGVNSLHLLSQMRKDQPVLFPNQLVSLNDPLLDYFELNFGFLPCANVGDQELFHGRQVVQINKESYATLHQVLYQHNPINRALLSAQHYQTSVLRSFGNTHFEDVEVIVARNTEQIADLLYWWNRQLYECHRLFYVTMQDLAILDQDAAFAIILHDSSPHQHISVASCTLSSDEVQDLIQHRLTPARFHRFFRNKPIDSFPFKVDDTMGGNSHKGAEPVTTQVIAGREGLLNFPSLSFTSSVRFSSQRWVVDIKLEEENGQEHKELLFPWTADSSYLLRNIDGRVNKEHRLSYYVRNHASGTTTIKFQIPPFSTLLQQLISTPKIDGDATRSGYQYIDTNDCGNRLRSFLHLFKNDFITLHDYLSDRFWMDLLKDCCTAEKQAGNAFRLDELARRCRHLMEAEGHPFGPRSKSWRNKENLRLGLKRMVAELTNLHVLQPGYTLKCPHCAYIAWYPMDRVDRQIDCSGCQMPFPLPIDPSVFYRLNSLVEKNFYQSRSQPDGNGTVIQLLTRLAWRNINYPFVYSPQIDVFTDFRSNKPFTDLDIVACERGEFIIGEAKYDSEQFKAHNNKCLTALETIAKAIRPDRIILACTEDSNDRLQNAKKTLDGKFYGYPYKPEIEAIQISSPTYFNFRGSQYFAY